MRTLWQHLLPFLLFSFLSFLLSILLCWLYRVPGEFWVLFLVAEALLLAGVLIVEGKRFRSAEKALASHDYRASRYLPAQESLLEALKESQRQQRNQALEEARHTRELLDYFSLWAHQSKLPVSALGLLAEEEPVNPSAIKAQIKRLDQYVNMAMTYLRLNTDTADYRFENQPLDDLIRPVIRSFSSEFISGHIALDFAGTDAEILTDGRWFTICLEQFLSNALRYTPPGGTITIAMESDVLVIADTGPGIPKEDLPRIFENGFTGLNGHEQMHTSSGIGLYLCRRILQQLHHPFWIEADQGTRVCIDLRTRTLLES